jgi:hypothetical protein
VTVPLPWERLLWSGRPTPLLPHVRHRERYVLTDMRIVRMSPQGLDELATCDIGDVQRTQTRLERLLGVSTLEIRDRDDAQTMVLRGIRRAPQLAALVDLLATDPRARANPRAVGAAAAVMAWEPRLQMAGARTSLRGIAAVVSAAAIALVVLFSSAGIHGTSAPISYPANDAIYPNGRKKSPDEIVRFMEQRVMPWARQALAPIVGSPELVTCNTCHGTRPDATAWHMPAVAALPRPAVKVAGWENYGGVMDDQMRNAIYGYGAESDRLSRAAYMREVVMPGMARLLGREAYDFTRPYAFNRTHFAFGCYQCHQVK